METKKQKLHLGFTILELMIVVGIMGLLGTVSVSGFRGLRKGMEERAAKQTVDEFIHSAYRRAVIDRVPVHIYFWNETISDESSGVTADKKLVVVGHAVAVRRAGRISQIDGQFLIDEFGDLAQDLYKDEDGKYDPDDDSYKDDPGRYLYRMKTFDQFQRSVASSITVKMTNKSRMQECLISRPDQTVDIGAGACGFYVKPDGEGEKVVGIGTWKVGDPYGFEIAELTLPKNFIFGSKGDYSDDVTNPERAVNDFIVIKGTGEMPKASQITVCGLKLKDNGEPDFESIGKSEDPRYRK